MAQTPEPKITGVQVQTDKDTVKLTWAVDKVVTSGPRTGRAMKCESTVFIPRTVFATAVEAWRALEGP